MHPALKVPDIISLVFGCDVEKNDLFHCSLVCRLWGIWASDVLWRTRRVPLQAILQSLAPITKKIRKFDRLGIPGQLYIEIENIDERGWRRFLLLSNKIASLNVDCGIGKTSLERIELAKQSFDGEPFAQLQDVTTTIEDGDHFTIEFITVPSLKKVHLSCINLKEDSMSWVADRMPVTAPNIIYLGFNLGLSGGIGIEISRYSALRYLSICSFSINPRFWESLTGCQLLTSIVLEPCFEIKEWGMTCTWTVDFVYFPALRTLTGTGLSTVTPTLVLRSRMPMLEYLWWQTLRWEDPGHAVNVDRVAAHLKVHSPKFDTDLLYRIKGTDYPSVNGNDLW